MLNGSFVDHFCVTSKMWSSVKSAAILDSGLNLSDHSPISTCICADVSPQPIPRTVHLEGRLRWDKADLATYYHETYNKLSQICVPVDFLHCLPGCQGDIHRLMRQAKLAYKNATRAADVDADLAISNDLHEYLMQKMISF